MPAKGGAKRRRSSDDDDDSRAGKRQTPAARGGARRMAPVPLPGEEEALSALVDRRQAEAPNKAVHFPSRLVSGPTKSPADHRHKSPERSSIHKKGQAAKLGLHQPGQDVVEDIAEGFGGIGIYSPPRSKKAASPVRGTMATNLSDEDVCERLMELHRIIGSIANDVPEIRGFKGSVVDQLLVPNNEHTVRYIGCLAMGGPNGKQGWEQLLSDHEARKALVWGILGRALKEAVFGELWFGASENDKAELRRHEASAIMHDGFKRTIARAEICQRIRDNFNDDRQNALVFAETELVLQLEKLLSPLWHIGVPTASRRPGKMAATFREKLAELVDEAVDLSHLMRLQKEMVFYWPPTFKDEEYAPSRMECLNMRHMIETSPYRKQERHGYDRAVLQPGKEAQAEAIVCVVCFPGLVVYRQGGGDLAQRQLQAEGIEMSSRPPDVNYVLQTRDNSYSGYEGFRTRVLGKAVVYLQWGKQRLLTKEAGTSVYLDAVRDGSNKYEKDYEGFVELYDMYRHIHAMRSTNGGRRDEQEQSGRRRSSGSRGR